MNQFLWSYPKRRSSEAASCDQLSPQSRQVGLVRLGTGADLKARLQKDFTRPLYQKWPLT